MIYDIVEFFLVFVAEFLVEVVGQGVVGLDVEAGEDQGQVGVTMLTHLPLKPFQLFITQMVHIFLVKFESII